MVVSAENWLQFLCLAVLDGQEPRINTISGRETDGAVKKVTSILANSSTPVCVRPPHRRSECQTQDPAKAAAS